MCADSSRTIQSLVYLGDANDGSVPLAVNTVIAPGQTLSVLGTNGFFIGRRVQTGNKPHYNFLGREFVGE